MEQPCDIFLSYSWSIFEQINQFDRNLTKLGLKIYKDEKGQNSDKPLTNQIVNAIKEAKTFVCCISTEYCKSINCCLQVEYAYSIVKPIIVLMIENLKLEDVNNIKVTGRKNTNCRIGFLLNTCNLLSFYDNPNSWFSDSEKLNNLKICLNEDLKKDITKTKSKSESNKFDVEKGFSKSTSSKDENRKLKKIVYKNKYERLDYINAGAFGEVFTALNLEDEQMFEFYALKITQYDESLGDKSFDQLNEAKLLRSLSSPYIVKYCDCFLDSARIFLVTEYCKDGDLAKRIRETKSLNQTFEEETIFSWSQEMIFGIYFLHSHSIIHRDIKPGNIFLQNGHVKLGDLGCAKNILISLAQSLKGTVKYMSPEMISGKTYDCKTDIWSVGIIIYELITLEYPFKGNSLYELVQSILIDNILAINTTRILKNLIKMMLQRELDVRADSKQLKHFLED